MEEQANWQARYQAALRYLDNPQAVVRMARAVASVDMGAVSYTHLTLPTI